MKTKTMLSIALVAIASTLWIATGTPPIQAPVKPALVEDKPCPCEENEECLEAGESVTGANGTLTAKAGSPPICYTTDSDGNIDSVDLGENGKACYVTDGNAQDPIDVSGGNGSEFTADGNGLRLNTTMTGGTVTINGGGAMVHNQDNGAGGTTYHSNCPPNGQNMYFTGGEGGNSLTGNNWTW